MPSEVEKYLNTKPIEYPAPAPKPEEKPNE